MAEPTPRSRAGVHCALCAEQVRDPAYEPLIGVVGDHSCVTPAGRFRTRPGQWRLAPVTGWQRFWHDGEEYFDLGTIGEASMRAVELTCPRCGTCTTWHPRTLAARITDPDYPSERLYVPDLKGARQVHQRAYRRQVRNYNDGIRTAE